MLLALLLVGVLGIPSAPASAGSLALPDNRAWEQVSPVEKKGNNVTGGAAMAAVDGNRLMFRSQGPFAGAETSLGVDGIRYMGTRTPTGWTTTNLLPPGGTFTFGFNGYQGFTEDLSKGVLAWREDEITGTLDPQAPIAGLNLYVRDTSSGNFQLLNGSFDVVGELNGFVSGSRDFGKLALQTGNHLTPDSPCSGAGSESEKCAYEWDHGELRLASVLPNGEPAEGTVGNAHRGNYEHAMSDDGRRLFFTSPPNNGSGGNALYVREDGITTTPISESERTLPGGASGGTVKYQSAEAAHGDRVLFSTRNSLLDADTDVTNDLYIYDLTAPEGERLTLVSEDLDPQAPVGADVDGGYEGGAIEDGGVVGTSEDLRRVYFVANNQIVDGASEAPGPKLYLWDDTGSSPTVTYIVTLRGSSGDPGEPFGDLFMWSAPSIGIREAMRTSRLSRDGRYLAFVSAIQLPEFNSKGSKEIYRYDAVPKSLVCVSCVMDAFPADGEIRFTNVFFGAKPINHPLGNVSGTGQVFFETSRGLVPRDSNGKMDVYEYEDGQLYLISRGAGDADSFFLDATPSGSDVFFTTKDRLVGWDTDGNYDAYDARVGGGLPEPPPPPPPCEGDACQPPPILPVDPSLASASFNGPGDRSARKPRRRCRAAKVRRHGKCRKKRGARQGTTGGGRQ